MKSTQAMLSAQASARHMRWRTAKAMTAAADAFCHATSTGPVGSCTSSDGSAIRTNTERRLQVRSNGTAVGAARRMTSS